MTSTSEIPAEILAGVKQALGRNYEHGPIKLVKMAKGTELEDRVLALTQYRTYILLFTARPKIEFKFNHLEIDSLESEKPLKLKFGFPKEKDRDKCHSFLMKTVNDSLDVVEFILKSLQRVFPLTSMDKLIRRIHLEPQERQSHMEARLNRMSIVEQGPCGGFSHMYKFMCDYFDLPYLAEVAWDVDTIYLSQDCKELRINDFDDLEAKHMLPIIAVLNYNTWFTHLTVVNYKLTSEALKEIPKVILTSHTLESLTLDGVGLKWDFLQEMSISLTANSASNLRSINLSNNPIDDRGIRHLCGPLQKMTHGLVELRLVKTGMTAEGASHLGKALGENNFIPTTLKVLDLSGNAFKDSQHGNLYNFLYQSNNITHLNLADTDCSLNHVFEALHKGCFLSLVHLNLSGTFAHSKHHSAVPRQVKNFFTSARSLKTLNMSRNRCPPALVREILESIGYNKDLERVDIDLSSNELGQEGADAISSCISMLDNVTTLNLRDNSFNVAMVSLVAWMGQNRSLESVDLSQNMNPNSKKADREKVVVALEEMIQNPDLPLHTIYLANNRFRLETQQLINALGSNTTLLSVDLSGNEMKDIGARLLAKALQINNKLQTVVIDNNSIGVQGFQDLAQAMERNFTMKKIPIPTSDMIASMGKNHEKTEAAIQKIQECLQRNHSPRKFSNKQAFLLQRGFLYTTAHQMVDKLVVHIEDMATELTQKSDMELQEKISKARGLIDDANNSKKIYDILQMVVGRSNDEDLTEKLRSIACLIESEMEARLEQTANGMVDGTSQLCSYVMQDRCLYEKIEDTCREHYKLPQRFVEDLVDQIGAETSNQCSEANLAMASFISDSILDEIIEQLSTVEAELSEELKKFRDEVANGTTVRMVDSIFDESVDMDEDEKEEEEEEENDEGKKEEEQKAVEKEKVEIKVEDEGSADGDDTDEGALQNGSMEELKQDEDTEASREGQDFPLPSPPPMTKKHNIRIQRHKSMKRPVSEFQPVVHVTDLDLEEDTKPKERLSPSPQDIPNLPDPIKSPQNETDGGHPISPKSHPLTPKKYPPKRKPDSKPKPVDVDFEAVSSQAATTLRDLRADRPRVSRAFRPERARPPRRPVNPNPSQEDVVEEESADDLSAMFSSPIIEGFEPNESPSSSPAGSQANLSDPKKSEKKNIFGGLFTRKKKEDKKESKKEKKETKKEKKEREEKERKQKEEKEKKEKEEREKKSKKKDKTPISSSSSYKSEPAFDDIDRASRADPKSPRLDLSSTPDSTHNAGAGKGKAEPEGDTPDAPTKPDMTEDQPKDKTDEPPAVSPKLMPKVALRPKTGVHLFGADVMQQMQQRNLRSSNNEDMKESPEPKSPTTALKPALRSSPPASEKVSHKPLVLPTSPSRSLSSPNQSPAMSPLSPKPSSPSPTSPRPVSTSPKPTPVSRPIPKPRKSELLLGADTKAPVKEMKEEEEKEKKEAARSGSIKSTASISGEKAESDTAKIDSKEQPPAAEIDPKPHKEEAAEKTKSELEEKASTEKKHVEESVLNQPEDKHQDEKKEESSKKSDEKEVMKEEKLQEKTSGKEETPVVSVNRSKSVESDETKASESAPKDSFVRTGSTSSDKSSPLISSGSQKDSEKKSEPMTTPKRDSTKSSSPPIAPKSSSIEGPSKRLSSKTKPVVSVRPVSTFPSPNRPVQPPPKPDGGVAEHRRSLKPVTARKPEVKERTSHIGLVNSGPKESNGESNENIPRRPSDIKKRGSKTSINGQAPMDATPNTTAETPLKEESEETSKEKAAIFV